MARAVSTQRQFVRAAIAAPYLERDEEHDLAVLFRQTGDKAALEKLTHSHMRLAIAVAARFKHFGLPMADLIQEAHIGLLEAAQRFEPDRQVRFSTYAMWWIRAALQDYVLRNWSIVRGGTSSTQKALFFNLRRLRAKLSQGHSPMPTTAMFTEIAEAVGVSLADVETMNARLSGNDQSLNAPLSDTEGSSADRQDFLVCDRPLQDEIVEDEIDGERRLRWLNEAMAVLSDREARILRERRLRDDSATLESLGERLGISKERVRQIETRALEKLKQALISRHPGIAAMI
ncbi:MAG: RNA polymerase factor sigma-32 [Hyphomicrobiaceae bacterium]|nr:RNA polymerase factor sigma-32 [Hyphomicrobiaceae bacterium]